MILVFSWDNFPYVPQSSSCISLYRTSVSCHLQINELILPQESDTEECSSSFCCQPPKAFAMTSMNNEDIKIGVIFHIHSSRSSFTAIFCYLFHIILRLLRKDWHCIYCKPSPMFVVLFMIAVVIPEFVHIGDIRFNLQMDKTKPTSSQLIIKQTPNSGVK